jgi:hypothetical protein
MLSESACGPKHELAAVQRCGRCQWNTGRSMDAADTAAPDPNWSFLVLSKAVRFPFFFGSCDRRHGVAHV